MAINLAINAMDAMPDGGRLTLAACRAGDHIEVSVKDTGSGIPEDLGRRIFEPFFTTKGPGRGTGLGLAVSNSIVREHGGTMEYSSVPGEGTEFLIRLPILVHEPEH